ncbi:SRPBCC family protein [Aeromicrobium duanguangcaii]|uniref:SRPBCC family protein n=1 Tax=Aeromicrobium duanguangcaii TaxID=2968086 RepID=A0ABY5KFC5_9ACTN|nr:SRPBCC family protein [Aeromicrobium duanguangcaii]MCD9154465.1 SRPBCC family protein [Aeromicrobium duanguangcaii]MCL3838213.1 SRPBCC family protein [Aeromicrobium duanguangcaii]UUI68478.1 SRPBCC family protein [Aeromicrobium duanguangcaii]
MTDDVVLRYSRTYPLAVDAAFDALLPLELPALFSRRYGAIPPIAAVRDQAGPWTTPGQTRTIQLADGGTMREELTAVESPSRFTYRIEGITGPMKPLVTSLDGAWTFEPVGTGVRIAWTWTVHPAGRLGSLAMPLFGRMWRGYARQAFENIERLVVR